MCQKPRFQKCSKTNIEELCYAMCYWENTESSINTCMTRLKNAAYDWNISKWATVSRWARIDHARWAVYTQKVKKILVKRPQWEGPNTLWGVKWEMTSTRPVSHYTNSAHSSTAPPQPLLGRQLRIPGKFPNKHGEKEQNFNIIIAKASKLTLSYERWPTQGKCIHVDSEIVLI